MSPAPAPAQRTNPWRALKDETFMIVKTNARQEVRAHDRIVFTNRLGALSRKGRERKEKEST